MIRALIDRAVQRKQNMAVLERMVFDYRTKALDFRDDAHLRRSILIWTTAQQQVDRIKRLSWLWLPIARWGEKRGYGG